MGLQETFIENLKYYRKQKKFSQKDLAIQLNKSYNYINNIEGGGSFPPPAVIDQIAEILKIDSSLLFSNSASPKNLAASYKRKFSRSLQDELSAQVTKTIQTVCRRFAEE